MSLKMKLSKLVDSKYAVIVISLISLLFSLTGNGGLGFIVLILLSLIILWLKSWKWDCFGLKKIKKLPKFIFKSIFYSIILIMMAFIIRPILENLLGQQDLSYFDSIRTNPKNFIVLLIQVWLLVAFFEEFVYRGYIMLQLEKLFSRTKKNQMLAVLISSIIFGFAHFYQGAAGIVFSGIIGFALGMIYYQNSKNLWLCILIHGLVDSTYLTLVYLSYDIKINHVFDGLLGV